MASSLMAVLTLHIRADVHLNILDKRDVHLDIFLRRMSVDFDFVAMWTTIMIF